MRSLYMKYRMVRIMFHIVTAVAITIAAVMLFLKLNPVFGGNISKTDKADYEKRAANYSNGNFFYPEEYELPGLSEDKRVSEKNSIPQDTLPIATPAFSNSPSVDEFSVTWLGHSTLFMQMHGMNILTDPVFSERTSPVSFIGPKRYSDLPMTPDELPDIDIVVITHDHYDHLDMDSIKKLDDKTKLFVVPLGVENHLERWGVSSDKIHNMAWWEETEINGLTIACTPARHYSNRSISGGGTTLFASWVFKDENYQIYESGDSGYGAHFKAIYEKYGEFDLVLTDCAQYNMQWHYIHMFPEEAAKACETLGAKISMPIHWGAYSLSSHGWDDPAERFVRAAENEGLKVITPLIGETVRLDAIENYMDRWWRGLR